MRLKADSAKTLAQVHKEAEESISLQKEKIATLEAQIQELVNKHEETTEQLKNKLLSEKHNAICQLQERAKVQLEEETLAVQAAV